MRIGYRSIPTHQKVIYDGLSETQGLPLSTTVYFDSNHSHDQVTRLSVSGVICFVDLIPILLV